MTAPRLEILAVTLSLTWATLAFGGVYVWGYAPAYVLVSAAALSRLWRNRGALDPTWRVTAAACALGIAVVGAQLIPLPPSVAGALSPNLGSLLARSDLAYAMFGAEAGWLPLSIQPAQTLTAWLCGVALALLVLSLAAEFAEDEQRTVWRTLLALGAVISVIGMVQRATGTGELYGFWVPENGARPLLPAGGPFGSFINRNHFAGWMLLAIPLGYAHVSLRLRSMQDVPDTRRRILWLQTRDGAEAVLGGAALCIMALGLMLTVSRSGIGAFLLMMAVAAVIGLLKPGNRLKALAVTVAGVAVVSGLVARAGPEMIGARFERASRDLTGRQRTWSDAVRIFNDFRLVGTGTNTYDRASLFYEPPGLEVHYAQAHNDYLQLLAESGLVGGAAFVLMATLLAWAAWRRFAATPAHLRVVRVAALAGLAAIAVQEVVDFSLHMPANALLAAVALAALVAPHAGGVKRRSHGSQRTAERRDRPLPVTATVSRPRVMAECSRVLVAAAQRV